MSNLAKRVIFGILGGALLIFLIIFNQYTFIFFILMLNILGLSEFYTITGLKKDFNVIVTTILGTLLIGGLFVLEVYHININLFYLIFPGFFLLFLIQLFRKDENPTRKLGMLFLGLVYVSVPLMFSLSIAFVFGTFNYELFLGMLFLIWANDTGAYFSGKSLGRTKLFERISPKKTWEGSIGGLVLSLGVAYVISIYWTSIPTHAWLTIAAITTVFGGLGDLVESMMKRDLQIKDSGSLIPGHGGILDRFDALLIAAPFVYFYLMIFNLVPYLFN